MIPANIPIDLTDLTAKAVTMMKYLMREPNKIFTYPTL